MFFLQTNILPFISRLLYNNFHNEINFLKGVRFYESL